MSYRDKTYVNLTQYRLMKQFWLDTYDEQVRLFGGAQWLYPFSYFNCENSEQAKLQILNNNKEDEKYISNKSDVCLFNTGTMYDIWLAKNCKFDFIQQRLIKKYSKEWWVFKTELDFSEKCWICSISEHNNNNRINFHYEKKDYIYSIDDFLVYGTTKFLKSYDDVLDIIFSSKPETGKYRIIADFFGCYLYIYNNKWHLEIKDEEVIEIEPIFNLNKSGWDLPNIVYTLNMSDCDTYNDNQIILSTDSNWYTIDQFINNEGKNNQFFIKRQLPTYVLKYIK